MFRKETDCKIHSTKPQIEFKKKYIKELLQFAWVPECMNCWCSEKGKNAAAEDLTKRIIITEAYLQNTLDRFLDSYHKLKSQLVQTLTEYRNIVNITAQDSS